jgi:hypothetical protein
LWLVTDSEARHLIDREPFVKALKGLPPDDRMAVVRMAVETWRRQRGVGVNKRATLAKLLTMALQSYKQWRTERPDDYALWRDVLKGVAKRETTDTEVDDDIAPRWQLIELDAYGEPVAFEE